MNKNYVCFISDVHLGLQVGDFTGRERRLVSAIESLPDETTAVYLLGDIFDFWYEYKYVVPKGYTRFFGALARLSDRGVKLYFFKGNHDVWAFGYFRDELGMEILDEPYVTLIGDKKFCMGHGDGLPRDDKKYLFLRSVFHNKFLQRMFSNIHPRWAFALAGKWSVHNRLYRGTQKRLRLDEHSLYKYVCEREKTQPADYYVFGHLHNPGDVLTPAGGKMYILGEWIMGCDYLLYESVSDTMQWRTGLKD
jgi:UDP-2,3-diacylglucosamine hydrolase